MKTTKGKTVDGRGPDTLPAYDARKHLLVHVRHLVLLRLLLRLGHTGAAAYSPHDCTAYSERPCALALCAVCVCVRL